MTGYIVILRMSVTQAHRLARALTRRKTLQRVAIVIHPSSCMNLNKRLVITIPGLIPLRLGKTRNIKVRVLEFNLGRSSSPSTRTCVTSVCYAGHFIQLRNLSP